MRQHLSSRQDLTRLHFQLRSHGQLVSPAGEAAPGLQGIGAAEAIMSLAKSSVFSVYLPSQKLTKAEYRIFYQAVRPFLSSTDASQRAEPLSIARQENYSNQTKEDHAPLPEYVNEDERSTTSTAKTGNDTVAATTPSDYGPPGSNEFPGYPDEENEALASASKSMFPITPDFLAHILPTPFSISTSIRTDLLFYAARYQL